MQDTIADFGFPPIESFEGRLHAEWEIIGSGQGYSKNREQFRVCSLHPAITNARA